MSIKKLSNPVAYEVRWREHAANRSRRFKLRADAEAWEREVKRRKQLGPLALSQLTTRPPTLGEWIEQRWALEHGSGLSARTREVYARSYEHHAAPWLDDLHLDELTVGRLREWQAQRLLAGVTADAITKTRTMLSSVLRHAAEAEAIPGNPLRLVRAPKAEHREEVMPLAPLTVEAIRAALLSGEPRRVPASAPGQRHRDSYVMAPRPLVERQRDAGMVSVLAYGGLRPGELRALRWGDVRERTLLVQRAVAPDGSIKATKNRVTRTVRMLPTLVADLREWRMASGRRAGAALVFPRTDGGPMDQTDWANWRSRSWANACRAAGVEPPPRPYVLRHGFASLLLAEGRSVHYVAGQLGHGPDLTLRTYGHVLAEFEDAPRIDAEREITKARAEARGRAPRRRRQGGRAGEQRG